MSLCHVHPLLLSVQYSPDEKLLPIPRSSAGAGNDSSCLPKHTGTHTSVLPNARLCYHWIGPLLVPVIFPRIHPFHEFSELG